MGDPAKSSKAWARAFALLVASIHPDYALNRNYAGRLIECVRQLPCGLLASHNCIVVRGSYYHCFALIFTGKRLSPLLASPFVAGSRFDHNDAVQSQVMRSFGVQASRGLHSVHSWRTRAEELVLTTCAAAETRLLPHYLTQLRSGRKLIIHLFDTALEILQHPPQPATSHSRTSTASALDLAGGRVSKSRYPDVVATYRDDFQLLAADLPSFVAALNAL